MNKKIINIGILIQMMLISSMMSVNGTMQKALPKTVQCSTSETQWKEIKEAAEGLPQNVGTGFNYSEASKSIHIILQSFDEIQIQSTFHDQMKQFLKQINNDCISYQEDSKTPNSTPTIDVKTNSFLTKDKCRQSIANIRNLGQLKSLEEYEAFCILMDESSNAQDIDQRINKALSKSNLPNRIQKKIQETRKHTAEAVTKNAIWAGAARFLRIQEEDRMAKEEAYSREVEAERQRAAEEERQRKEELEAERQRAAEEERQRKEELEAERQRAAEEERQKELEQKIIDLQEQIKGLEHELPINHQTNIEAFVDRLKVVKQQYNELMPAMKSKDQTIINDSIQKLNQAIHKFNLSKETEAKQKQIDRNDHQLEILKLLAHLISECQKIASALQLTMDKGKHNPEQAIKDIDALEARIEGLQTKVTSQSQRFTPPRGSRRMESSPHLGNNTAKQEQIDRNDHQLQILQSLAFLISECNERASNLQSIIDQGEYNPQEIIEADALEAKIKGLQTKVTQLHQPQIDKVRAFIETIQQSIKDYKASLGLKNYTNRLLQNASNKSDQRREIRSMQQEDKAAEARKANQVEEELSLDHVNRLLGNPLNQGHQGSVAKVPEEKLALEAIRLQTNHIEKEIQVATEAVFQAVKKASDAITAKTLSANKTLVEEQHKALFANDWQSALEELKFEAEKQKKDLSEERQKLEAIGEQLAKEYEKNAEEARRAAEKQAQEQKRAKAAINAEKNREQAAQARQDEREAKAAELRKEELGLEESREEAQQATVVLELGESKAIDDSVSHNQQMQEPANRKEEARESAKAVVLQIIKNVSDSIIEETIRTNQKFVEEQHKALFANDWQSALKELELEANKQHKDLLEVYQNLEAMGLGQYQADNALKQKREFVKEQADFLKKYQEFIKQQADYKYLQNMIAYFEEKQKAETANREEKERQAAEKQSQEQKRVEAAENAEKNREQAAQARQDERKAQESVDRKEEEHSEVRARNTLSLIIATVRHCLPMPQWKSKSYSEPKKSEHREQQSRIESDQYNQQLKVDQSAEEAKQGVAAGNISAYSMYDEPVTKEAQELPQRATLEREVERGVERGVESDETSTFAPETNSADTEREMDSDGGCSSHSNFSQNRNPNGYFKNQYQDPEQQSSAVRQSAPNLASTVSQPAANQIQSTQSKKQSPATPNLSPASTVSQPTVQQLPSPQPNRQQLLTKPFTQSNHNHIIYLVFLAVLLSFILIIILSRKHDKKGKQSSALKIRGNRNPKAIQVK